MAPGIGAAGNRGRKCRGHGTQVHGNGDTPTPSGNGLTATAGHGMPWPYERGGRAGGSLEFGAVGGDVGRGDDEVVEVGGVADVGQAQDVFTIFHIE